MEFIVNLIIFLILAGLGYFAGTAAEQKHFQSIKKRERKYRNIPVVTGKRFIDPQQPIQEATLVTGSAVISTDYFKTILANLINFFGGEMSSYESLLDRARREAILRMKEECPNAHIIANLRIETATIGGNQQNNQGIVSVEAMAYGTAITYVTSPTPVFQEVAEADHSLDFAFRA